jgi:2-hydroxy-3-keto-5-methylthiopentenyl-1-phosphate phosphatase
VENYLLASDFDQTLSFNDSGIILSELLGETGFEEKVKGLSRINLVQQGGELAYLLLHDPAYRRARREHLIETGKRIALKKNIRQLKLFLSSLGDEARFAFHVISAAPEEVIQSALEGIVPPENINGTRFRYDSSGEIESILRVPAGYGKVAVLEELRDTLGVSRDHLIYVGDGSSDVHVMLHVNQHDGLTIAVSEARFISQIARRTVLGDDALCVMIPVLEDALGWNRHRIRAFFRGHGLQLEQWDRVRTDWLKISAAAASAGQAEVMQ